jgi:hypothetical protein
MTTDKKNKQKKKTKAPNLAVKSFPCLYIPKWSAINAASLSVMQNCLHSLATAELQFPDTGHVGVDRRAIKLYQKSYHTSVIMPLSGKRVETCYHEGPGKIDFAVSRIQTHLFHFS